MTIPRTLHQIWVGPEPAPAQLDEWEQMHRSWDYRLWDAPAIVNAIDWSGELGAEMLRRMSLYSQGERWHGVADIARLMILDQQGGVYVDADTVPVKPLTSASFMRKGVGFWAAYAPANERYPELVSNAYMGAAPGHPILQETMRRIAADEHLLPTWIHSGAVVLSGAIAVTDTEDVRLLEAHQLFPVDRKGNDTPAGKGAVYARHLYGSTGTSEWQYGDPSPALDAYVAANVPQEGTNPDEEQSPQEIVTEHLAGEETA